MSKVRITVKNSSISPIAPPKGPVVVASCDKDGAPGVPVKLTPGKSHTFDVPPGYVVNAKAAPATGGKRKAP